MTLAPSTATLDGDVMVDQRLEPGDSHKAAKLATRIEEAYAGREVPAVEVTEGDQGDRQEQEAEAEAAQQDGRHHVVRAAFAGRAGQHPHRNHDHQDSEGHGGDRRNAANLDEEGGDEERADEERAAWQQQQAGVGRREREDGHGKRRDQERAPEQGGAGDKADDEGEGKIVRPEQGEIEQALAFGHHLLAEKCQQRGGTDHRQPQDARLLEPVPSAALAEDIGEAE